jgi:DNA-binding Lrp family transcriptional regulator
MTDIERRLLNLVQKEFPLDIRPFRSIAEQLDISEAECIETLRRFSDQGIFRGIKPLISWKDLGYSSVLIGMDVDEKEIDAVASEINKDPGVTHNYSRKGPLNLWCTFTYENKTEKDDFIEKLYSLSGVVKCREFPAEKTYKIGLVLDV